MENLRPRIYFIFSSPNQKGSKQGHGNRTQIG